MSEYISTSLDGITDLTGGYGKKFSTSILANKDKLYQATFSSSNPNRATEQVHNLVSKLEQNPTQGNTHALDFIKVNYEKYPNVTNALKKLRFDAWDAANAHDFKVTAGVGAGVAVLGLLWWMSRKKKK